MMAVFQAVCTAFEALKKTFSIGRPGTTVPFSPLLDYHRRHVKKESKYKKFF